MPIKVTVTYVGPNHITLLKWSQGPAFFYEVQTLFLHLGNLKSLAKLAQICPKFQIPILLKMCENHGKTYV